jgi:hypothetical protein
MTTEIELPPLPNSEGTMYDAIRALIEKEQSK